METVRRSLPFSGLTSKRSSGTLFVRMTFAPLYESGASLLSASLATHESQRESSDFRLVFDRLCSPT
jgi:hypothetical protein